MAATLDTLKVLKRLREGGLSEPQAEAVTDVLRDSREFDLTELATKSDIAGVRSEIAELRFEIVGVRSEMRSEVAGVRSEIRSEFAVLRAEMAALRSEMLARIEASKAETIKWMIGISLAQLAALFAVARFFLGHPS
jgi:hypothetical protein